MVTSKKPTLDVKVWAINPKDHPAGTMLLGAIHGGSIDFPDVTEIVILRWSPSKKFFKMREVAPIPRIRWCNAHASLTLKCLEVIGIKSKELTV